MFLFTLLGWGMAIMFGSVMLFFLWTMFEDLDEKRKHIFIITLLLLLLGVTLIFV